MKTIALFLALCLLLSCAFLLASCGKTDATEPDTTGVTDPAGEEATDPANEGTTAGEPAETTAVTTDKWEALAPQVTRLSARDRLLKIECSCRQTAVKASKNDIYLKGPDEIVDGVTPPIQQMVYDRNRAADALLGTTTEFVFWDLEFGEQQPQIDLVVKGNAVDAPDLFVNMLNDLSHEMMNGAFKDVWSIPGSFFDFSTEGWLRTWMRNMSFTDDRAYLLGSDYFIDILRAMSVIPFNKTMMDKNAVKLAPAVIGEDEDPLGEGEKLSVRFFDLVERGDWTWDVLGKLCEAIWEDSDGDGADSIRDRLGILTDSFGGDAACGFVYSSGVQVTEAYPIEDPTSEYNEKQWIKYADTSEGLNLIFEKVKNVFVGAGSLTTAFDRPYNTPEQPGLSYHYTKFAAGEVLFIGSLLLGALENDTIQQMQDIYSVVPCPKADASKPYNTIIYNSGDVGAINVNIGPRKAKTLTAYLQYCTEHSGAIREQFLENVMKYKVTTYDQGTDRMLNIIYDGIMWGRDKTVEDLNNEPRWHGLMRSNAFTVGADFISQQYESFRTMKQNLLNKTMEKWYTLPKVEQNAN